MKLSGKSIVDIITGAETTLFQKKELIFPLWRLINDFSFFIKDFQSFPGYAFVNFIVDFFSHSIIFTGFHRDFTIKLLQNL